MSSETMAPAHAAPVANAGWIFAERAVRIGFDLTLGIWVARHLGPHDYGVLAYALALVALFAPLASLGLEVVLLRELVNNPGERSSILGTAAALKFAGSCAAGIAAIIAVAIIDPADARVLPMVMLIASARIFLSADVIDADYQAQGRMRRPALARLACTILISVAKAVVLLASGNLLAFAWIAAGESVLLGLCLMTSRSTDITGGKVQFAWPWMRRLLRDSWPLALSAVMITLYMRIDQVMLEYWVNAREVGRYAVAVRLSEGLFVIPMTLSVVISPVVLATRTKQG
ncbi:MAG: oligosaccharide flippase family protein, partial [Planctomycetes bacterium]|nr:oligosaccharide flippase family protein [Planctomycetota bacterium]